MFTTHSTQRIHRDDGIGIDTSTTRSRNGVRVNAFMCEPVFTDV